MNDMKNLLKSYETRFARDNQIAKKFLLMKSVFAESKNL